MNKEKILKMLVVSINLIVIIRLFNIGIINHNFYKQEYNDLTQNTYYSSSAPRGRIMDANGNILVDNKGIKSLIYKKNASTDIKHMCESLASILDIANVNVSEFDLKSYYYYINKDKIDSLLDKKMIEKYNSKLISKNEFEEYKYSFIRDSELNSINETEVYIYKIINSGYSFDEKIIKNDITEEELIKINELNISGLEIKLRWVRVYNYDTVLNDLFGTIGPIAKENVNYYLENGYNLNDIVGTTFLEAYYEDYLKGEKAEYKLNKDNELELIIEEKRGTDLVLSIDIEKQLEIERVLKEEIKTAKMFPSSKYYKGSYVVVSEPNSGAIKTIAGFNYQDGFTNDIIGILTNSYTVGSIVKGASQSVAYINNVIDVNKRINDSCIKLKNLPYKCSWARLGMINDIDALTQSSNYYQFINAIKVSGYNYTYNMEFNPTIDDFNKYRDVFKDYGLGTLSEIDLFEEKLGITGSTVSGDLLLNFTIGQYDTYTPLMIASYINTIASNGTRYKLRLVDYGIDQDGNRVDLNNESIVSNVGIQEEHLKRVQEGLRSVIARGTAAGYVNSKYNAAGKTGTSETFYNGISTTTKSFIMYAPFNDPKYSLVIISPNIGYANSPNSYKYPINSRLSNKISNILFEN
ncbi:MAG: hypothetical protein J1F35_01205 [Erysipelotrichales bacterium]|nr:hypothetical protein [Erysipelotrichales bacterium]